MFFTCRTTVKKSPLALLLMQKSIGCATGCVTQSGEEKRYLSSLFEETQMRRNIKMDRMKSTKLVQLKLFWSLTLPPNDVQAERERERWL
jgi:hypothetical protein